MPHSTFISVYSWSQHLIMVDTCITGYRVLLNNHQFPVMITANVLSPVISSPVIFPIINSPNCNLHVYTTKHLHTCMHYIYLRSKASETMASAPSNMVMSPEFLVMSPEFLALQKNSSNLCTGIARISTVTSFAQLLEERGIITSDAKSSILSTTGSDDFSKCARLLDAVKEHMKIDATKFKSFVGILSREAALKYLADMVIKRHGRCIA